MAHEILFMLAQGQLRPSQAKPSRAMPSRTGPGQAVLGQQLVAWISILEQRLRATYTAFSIENSLV